MSNNYTSQTVQTLSFMEHIRKYPGMYIGSKDSKGLLHCAKEIISNSIDEFLNGAGDTIKITVNTKENSILIEDNARGIPHGEHSPGVSTLQACFGVANTGGKYLNATGESGYNTSGGEHGVGGKAVNALSTKMLVSSSRDGIKETIEFSKGEFISSRQEKTSNTGLSVFFIPDAEIFDTITIDTKALREMVREFSFLCSGLAFVLTIDKEVETFMSKEGLVDYLNYLRGNRALLIEPAYLSGHEGQFNVEAVVGYTSNYSGTYRLFTNNIPQEKGTHLTGFKTAWTSSLNSFAREKGWIKEKEENLTGADYEEGQILILNFKMIDPVFKGQNKEELSSSEGRAYVQKIISEELKYWLAANEKSIKIVVDKALNARKAREAARKAKDAARGLKEKKKKKVINPDKLKDAEHLGSSSILLLVEGNSAAASMSVARDTEKYGILALRGKVLNLLTNDKTKADKNEEIQLLISALGITPGAYDSSDLRYGKLAICSDSDSDGAHIGLLIATAIQVLCPEFIQEGRLCWLRSPLYIVKSYGKESYYYTDEELAAARSQGLIKGEVQRNKGLGSLSAEQAAKSMFTDEFQRLDVLDYTSEAIELLINLMGSNASNRKDFIFKNIDFSIIKE